MRVLLKALLKVSAVWTKYTVISLLFEEDFLKSEKLLFEMESEIRYSSHSLLCDAFDCASANTNSVANQEY